MTQNKKHKVSLSGAGKRVRALLGHIPLNIGTLIFGLIFIYMVISVLMYLTANHIESYQVVSGPLAQNQTYVALALREEQVVTTTASGYITYYARENSKVSNAGIVYSLGDKKASAAVDELTEDDYARIRSSMAGFASSFDSDDFYNTYNYKYELEGTILQYSGMTVTESGDVPTTVAGQTVYTAPGDGIVLYSVDGYEDVSVDNLNRDIFNQKNYQIKNLQGNEKVTVGEDVYKLITSEEWSLVIPLTTEQTVQLAGRKTIRVKFLKDDASQTGKFTIISDDDGQFYARITFTSGMLRYSADRFLNIELVTNTRSGLKIPLSSIVKKDFYVIPKEYVTYNDEDGKAGFNKKIEVGKGQEASAEFIQATIYAEDEEQYYVDTTTFEDGDIIMKPDSQSTYKIGNTAPLEGVYCINKGYAVFRRISILDQNDEFCIVDTGTDYGIAQFDYIVKDGKTVREDDILFNL